MESEPNWHHIGDKTCYIPKVINFSVEKGYMLTGLKVSCKCLFHRPEREGTPWNLILKVLKWEMKYTKDRSQRAY